MLCRLWMVICSTAAREALPERHNRVCTLQGWVRFGSSLLALILLAFLPAYAQSAPSITSISPSLGPVSPVGRPVTISGSGFGASPGTVTFGGVAATPNSWSDTSIVVPVPSSLAVGFVDVVVTNASGTASNAVSFKVIPVITGVSPGSATIGTPISLTGTSFGDLQGSSTITFNGVTASPSTWSNTSITVPVPVGASNGLIAVTINGFTANKVYFYILPQILNLQPQAGAVGSPVTITGNGFGQTQNVVSGVTFNGVSATIGSWSDTSITATVPQSATSGNVVVTNPTGFASNGVNFTVGAAPTISSLSQPSGAIGDAITIHGSGFGSSQGNSTITLNGNPVTAANWSDTSATMFVPFGAASGPVVVTVGGVASNAVPFAVAPKIISLTRSSGPANSPVTIVGTSFGSAQGAVTFNGANLTPANWSDSSIDITIPAGAGSGNIAVTANGVTSNSVPFTVTAGITGLSPEIGPVGTVVTISGAGFGASPGTTGVVRFNGTAATPSTWSDGAIQAAVPAGATSGPVVVTIAGVASNRLPFNVTPSGSANSIAIAPSKAAMLVGATRTLTLADNFGRTVAGAAWTVDNTAVVTLSMDDPPVLTAQNPGIATITATSGNLTAQATVNVYLPGSNGGGLPAGTVLWSVPPSAGFGPRALLQAVPTSNQTPDLLSVETANGNTSTVIRGLMADGQQISTGFINESVATTIADNLGGTVSATAYGMSNSSRPGNLNSLIRMDGASGLQSWYYDSPGLVSTGAVRPDGTLFAVEQSGGYYSNQTGRLLGLDGASGNPVFQYQLPLSFQNHYGNEDDCTFHDSGFSSPQTGPMSIAPDNAVYVEVLTRTLIDVFDCNTFTNNLAGSGSTLQLLRAGASGTSLLPLSSSSSIFQFQGPGEVIPDGQGGVLATWDMNFQSIGTFTDVAHVTHVDQNGNVTDYTLPFSQLEGWCGDAPCQGDGSRGHLVLGDNNIAFASNSHELIAFDVNSGAVQWTRLAPQNHQFPLVAASAGSGVVATDLSYDNSNNPTEQVVSFDSTGNSTYDTSIASGITNLDYWTLGEYLGVSNTFQQIMSATPFQVALTAAPNPSGGSRFKNGSAKRLELAHFVSHDPFPPTVTLLNYARDFENVVPPAVAPSKYYLGDLPPASNIANFRQAVTSPIDIVAFMGHSYEDPGCQDPSCNPHIIPFSIGLVFGGNDKEWWIRSPQPGDNPKYQVPVPDPNNPNDTGIHIYILNKPFIQTQAKIVFIAACADNPFFEQLWNITDSSPNQALIVPEETAVFLPPAYVFWKELARSLTAGDTVDKAVASANARVLQSTFPDGVNKVQWKLIGGKDANKNYIRLY
jgi:hypothetical protein